MSNKTMKGYEIFKAIANKEIKDGTQFRMLKNENIYTYRNNNFVCRYGGMNIISILNDEFGIIEEQEEIDIQELEEIKEMEVFLSVDTRQTLDENLKKIDKHEVNFFFKINEIIRKQNKIVQYLEQLDKNIKEK